MVITANKEIREAAKCAGVRLWQVADIIGISDSHFSRKLRHELPDEDREKIMDIIAQLDAENGRVS